MELSSLSPLLIESFHVAFCLQGCMYRMCHYFLGEACGTVIKLLPVMPASLSECLELISTQTSVVSTKAHARKQ